MRDHPIPPVTESLQYRAIGIVRGKYRPKDPDQFTRGFLVDSNGVELEAVVLGRVLTLMRRHIDVERSHLWVVYPRCRDADHLHLQIAGIWEPSTLDKNNIDIDNLNDITNLIHDELPEGDDYFSIRGELIYTRPEADDLVIKIRQRARNDGTKPLPFKLNLKGRIPLDKIRHFISLQVRRDGNQLRLEEYEVIGPIATRGGKKKGGKASPPRNTTRKINPAM